MEDIRSGFVMVNKPVGITSAQCLNKIKRSIPRKTKIGHAGTLDLFASGLLVIGIGRPATRQLHNIMQMNKRYIVKGLLGVETDTLDRTGSVVKRKDAHHITEADLKRIVASFGSSYQQTPPLFSALKHNGQRLSDLVRKQKLSPQELDAVVAAKARVINIYSLQLKEVALPFFTCEVLVSHGTYIRSLVRDIGSRLGSCATTQDLCRTAIGGFTLEDAVCID